MNMSEFTFLDTFFFNLCEHVTFHCCLWSFFVQAPQVPPGYISAFRKTELNVSDEKKWFLVSFFFQFQKAASVDTEEGE